ncbi:hypothetical protein C0389_03625 [bacterium]|nr:hypothetical protein [bacterium]
MIITSRICIIFILASVTANYAQEKNLSVFLLTGSANPSTGGFTVSGSGGTLGPWKSGFQLTAGIEYPLDKKFSVRGMINYSRHSYDDFSTRWLKNNDPVFSMFDIWGDLKLNIWRFYLHLGAGFSFQNGEAVSIWYEGKRMPMYESPERKNVLFTGLLGFGVDVKIYSQFSLIAEADILMREYAGASASLGVKYTLE